MGLKKDIEEIKKYIKKDEEKKKVKKFRLPKKVGRQKKKKNWVTLQILNDNSEAEFKRIQIEDQTIMHESIPRLASAGYVFHYKKTPLIILPSWSVQPISALEHYKESLKDGSNTKGYALLLARMLKEQTTSSKKVGKIIPWIIGSILIGIIAYAFITGGG